MVRAEDASKINRIVRRFKLATVDTANIKSEIQKSRAAKQAEKTPDEKLPAEKGTPAEKSVDDFLDELMAQPNQPEPIKEQPDNPNPTTAKTEKPLPSEPIYERGVKSAEGMSEPERKSVRQELKEIREAQKEQAEPRRETVKEQAKSNQPPSKANRPKTKSKSKKPKER